MSSIEYTEKELVVFETNDLQHKQIQVAEFNKNELQYGTIKWEDGDLYKGYLQNGEPHGPGSMTYASGIKNEGEYQYDLKNGRF